MSLLLVTILMTSGVWYKLGAITIGALIIRIGFWGILYYSYNKEPPNSIGNYQGV